MAKLQATLSANFANAQIYKIALLARAIRFKYPFLKLRQANVLSHLERQTFGTAYVDNT